MKYVPIPTFKTKRLILKGVTLDDAASYKKYFVDYDVIRYLSNIVPWPYPENGVDAYLSNTIIPNQGKGNWTWGIFLQSNANELIGAIELRMEGKPENRGFWLGKEFWGKGIMTEATIPVLDFAFEIAGFKKLVFGSAVGNHASRKVKEKTGCTLVGIEAAKFVDPSFTEKELWELTKEDWLKHKKLTRIIHHSLLKIL